MATEGMSNHEDTVRRLQAALDEVERLEDVEAQQVAINRRLQDEVDRLRSANEKNKAYVLELEAEVERLQNYVVDLKAENAMTLREPELIREVERLREECEIGARRNRTMEETIERLRAEARLDAPKELYDENINLKAEVKRLRDGRQRDDEYIQELNDEVERLRGITADLEDELDERVNVIERLRDEIRDLRGDGFPDE